MKQWWLALSLREKQMVSLGSIAIIFFIIYAWLWLPLEHNISAMRTQVVQNQKLLAWMQAADKQLENSKDKAPIASSTHSSASLLSVAQQQLKQSTLARQPYQLRQAETDKIQLSFKQVDFDSLVTWLDDTWQKQGLSVAQLRVAPIDTPGMVSAELQLTTS